MPRLPKAVTEAHVLHRVTRADCGADTQAPTPGINGTSIGPRLAPLNRAGGRFPRVEQGAGIENPIITRARTGSVKALLVLLAFAPLPAFAAVQPTDGGTLDVELVTVPEVLEAGQEAKMRIDFLNPSTQKTQVHIDYFLTVSEGGEQIFGPTNLIHTSEGRISVPFTFERDGQYTLDVAVKGILFNPIDEETASFPIFVGSAAAQSDPIQEQNGCLVATAAHGTELAPQVQKLREIRDSQLRQTGTGSEFMRHFEAAYYSFSPAVADLERQSPLFREAVRISITPMLYSLSVMERADSEASVAGYGAAAILMNLGFYAGLPAALVLGVRRAC